MDLEFSISIFLLFLVQVLLFFSYVQPILLGFFWHFQGMVSFLKYG